MQFKENDRVVWGYWHHLNSKSKTWIEKKGTVLEITGAVKSVRYVSGTHLKVLFDGNKTVSIVPVKDVKLIGGNDD